MREEMGNMFEMPVFSRLFSGDIGGVKNTFVKLGSRVQIPEAALSNAASYRLAAFFLHCWSRKQDRIKLAHPRSESGLP
jgi:hypothetical protein